MVAEWSRALAISSREQGDVGSSPSSIKILFSDENFLNNSRVHSYDSPPFKLLTDVRSKRMRKMVPTQGLTNKNWLGSLINV